MKKSDRDQNITTIVSRGWCSGCGTCAAICPQKALTIEYTADGRYIPRLIQGKCNHCALCMSVCPAANDNYDQLNRFVFGGIPEDKLLGHYTKCYTGYCADSSLRWKATSGGLITALLLYLLRSGRIDGALVTRINKDDPLKAEPFIARSEDDILASIGSKYVPIPLNRLLDQILSERGRFAVVGLPCHLHGIRRAEMKNKKLRDKINYHFGLVCSHTISSHGVEFVLEKIGVRPGQIEKLRYRGEGWPGGLRVLLKDKQKKFIANLNSWWSEIFGGFFFSHYYCTLCPDHFNEFSDISFADAWLSDIVKNDTEGSSIVITRTDRGHDLIQKAVSNGIINISTIRPRDAIRSQSAPLMFKKRNITVRMRILTLAGRNVPDILKGNSQYFIRATVFDYLAASIVYVNIFISKNRVLKSLLKYIPFTFLVLYRKVFKLLLAPHIKSQRRDKS